MEGGSCEMRGEVQGNLPSSQEMNHSGQVSQHLITMGRLESFSKVVAAKTAGPSSCASAKAADSIGNSVGGDVGHSADWCRA
jgi:hypothetical protein